MKKIVFFLLAAVISNTADAQLFRKTEPVHYDRQSTDSQKRVGKFRPVEKDIDYILEHYTDGELRNYAKTLNTKAIETAKANGDPLPEKLSEDTLRNRKKIGEYLRSYFEIPY